MEQIINQVWYVFGVGAALILGMGLVIRYLINEKEALHKEYIKDKEDTIEAVKDVTKVLTSLEILIKTMRM